MPPKGSAAAKQPTLSDSPAAVQQRANTVGIGEFELPKASVVKLAKGSIPDNVKMQQDVVLALLRSSTVFISYLTAAAHDQALARSGKSITASDVIKAITDLDFGPSDALVPLMEHELAAYRANIQAIKTSKIKPPGVGRGKGIRKPKAAAGDVEMGEEGEEFDEGGEDEVADEGEGGEEELDAVDDGAELS